MNFEAQFVALENDGEAHTVGFSDSEFDPQTYIILQLDLEPTEQDVSLGLDEIYITIDDQLRSTYGGVLGMVIHSRSIVIELSPEAARDLKVDGDITIDVDVAVPPMKDIKANLEALANGKFPVRSVD